MCLAAFFHHSERIKIRIEIHQADIIARKNADNTVLYLAMLEGNVVMTQLLTSYDIGDVDLKIAMAEQDCNTLLKLAAYITLLNSSHKTPMRV